MSKPSTPESQKLKAAGDLTLRLQPLNLLNHVHVSLSRLRQKLKAEGDPDLPPPGAAHRPEPPVGSPKARLAGWQGLRFFLSVLFRFVLWF